MKPIAGEFGLNGRYEFNPEAVESPEKVRGRLQFSSPIQPKKFEFPSFLEVHAQNWEEGTLQVTLTGGEKTQDSIRLVKDDGEDFIPILSGPAYFAVERTLNGDVEEALHAIQQDYSSNWGWEFRDDCKNALCFEAYVTVLNALTDSSADLAKAQFRSGISYFAKRILDEGPQGISSFETLRERVSYWNEKEKLKEVSLSEVIGEKLGRTWYRGDFGGEREDLVAIDFDPVTYDQEWETVVPACWIAHLLLSEGIDAARGFVRSRASPRAAEYGEIKQTAREADTDRGPAWGAVVAITHDGGSDDFLYDGFNYLKHTADEYHGKAKFTPLLYAGATELVPAYLPTDLHQELECKREITIGHNWRRDGAHEREKAAFHRAKEIARGTTDEEYEFDAFHFVDAEASLTHATAKTSDLEAEAGLYETALRNIRKVGEQYDVPDWKIQEEIEFLTECKQDVVNS